LRNGGRAQAPRRQSASRKSGLVMT
jgi:hypothetical protein